jgi:hypothetical protein
VRRTLRSYVEDYRQLLRGHIAQTQQILRRLIVGKSTFTLKLNGDYEFTGKGTVRPLLAGVVRKLASPKGLAHQQQTAGFVAISQWVPEKTAPAASQQGRQGSQQAG